MGYRKTYTEKTAAEVLLAARLEAENKQSAMYEGLHGRGIFSKTSGNLEPLSNSKDVSQDRKPKI